MVRSESALIRPFRGIDAADDALRGVVLEVEGEEYTPGSVVLADEDVVSARLTLRLPDPSDLRRLLAKTDVPDVDCGLVVIATGSTHRATKVLIQAYSRTADYPTEFPIDRSEAKLVFDDANGFSLTVAVVLLNDLEPKPLRPHMAGTWLARRDFKLRPESDDSSFSPEALTDEIRKQFGLPAGSLRYIHVDGVLFEDSISDAVRVYLDEDSLNLLLANPHDPWALQLQVELAIQATEAVAFSIARDLSESAGVLAPDMLEPYPSASRFVERLAAMVDRDIASTLELATEPHLLRPFLESKFSMRSVTSAALKDR